MRVRVYTEEVPRPGRRTREVISHSLLKHPHRFPPRRGDRHVNWVVGSGGTAPQLANLFMERIWNAEVPTTFLLHIWQNSIRQISLSDARAIVMDCLHTADEVNAAHGLRHIITFAEADFPPELRHHVGKTLDLNLMLRNINKDRGLPPCKPHRITSPAKYGRPGPWRTYSRWEEAEWGWGAGYHVHPYYLPSYFKFFRNYLKYL